MFTYDTSTSLSAGNEHLEKQRQRERKRERKLENAKWMHWGQQPSSIENVACAHVKKLKTMPESDMAKTQHYASSLWTTNRETNRETNRQQTDREDLRSHFRFSCCLVVFFGVCGACMFLVEQKGVAHTHAHTSHTNTRIYPHTFEHLVKSKSIYQSLNKNTNIALKCQGSFLVNILIVHTYI